VLARFAIEQNLRAQWLADFTSRRAAKFFGFPPRKNEVLVLSDECLLVVVGSRAQAMDSGDVEPWLKGEAFDFTWRRLSLQTIH